MGLKGLKEVLQERGLACTNVPEARNLLDAQPDFLAQKPAIQEILEKRGHIVVWCPRKSADYIYAYPVSAIWLMSLVSSKVECKS